MIKRPRVGDDSVAYKWVKPLKHNVKDSAEGYAVAVGNGTAEYFPLKTKRVTLGKIKEKESLKSVKEFGRPKMLVKVVPLTKEEVERRDDTMAEVLNPAAALLDSQADAQEAAPSTQE